MSAETWNDHETEPVEYLTVTQDEKLWAMLAHLAGLAGYAVGAGQIIGPLVIYLVYKDKSKYVAFHALQSLYLQLAIVVAAIASVIPAVLTFGLGIIVTIPILMLVAAVGIVYPVIAAIKAYEGNVFEYLVVGPIARDHVHL